MAEEARGEGASALEVKGRGGEGEVEPWQEGPSRARLGPKMV